MKTAASAQIIDGQYSLSELIAIENRIAYPQQTIPGFVGVGTSLRRNRVVVGFEDSGSLQAARGLFDGMGIDPQALILETWGKFEVSSTFASKLRPTRGGIEISVINRTKVPWPYHSAIFAGGTLGWNVKTTWGETYFLTAGHVAGMLTATNGATNDTIVQPYPKTADGGATWTVDKVGYIVWNPPFTEGAFACDYAGIDFCTDADVAMGHYLSGVSGESRIATSTYEGLNGLIGTYNINGFYPVADVLPPEMVVGGPLGVHKSGYMTGTTTGELDLSLSTINVTICWGVGMPGYPCPGKAMRYTGITLVRGMTNVGGDSGAPVFAGNGSPYHALGLLVGRGGNHDNDGNCTNVDLCFTFFFKWSSLENKLGYGPLTPVG